MSFYDDVIRKDPRFTSTQRISDLALLEPVTRAAVQAIMASAAAQGHKLVVTETFRSQARQSQLFAQGATQLRTVGVHGYGLAADIVRIDPTGAADWTTAHYEMLRDLAEANGLISGYDWGNRGMPHSFVDADHVQRINVGDQNRLFAGTWYPDPSYRPLWS